MKTELLLDLDGTVYLDGVVFDGLREEMQRVSDLGIGINYMTNNTSMSIVDYKKRISDKGLIFDTTKVFSPSIVAQEWLKANNIADIYLVGTDSLRKEIENGSFVNCMSDNPELVLIGFDKELTYQKLFDACGHINNGISWYQTHIDISCPTSDGPMPDCGAISNIIQETTNKPSSGDFGKPSKLFAEYVKSSFSHESELIVVGDRLYTDAETGLAMGARTVVVCTGEYKASSREKVDARIEVNDSLRSFLALNF